VLPPPPLEQANRELRESRVVPVFRTWGKIAEFARLEKAVYSAFNLYARPGNIREPENLVERTFGG
jgi:hypothetical protein